MTELEIGSVVRSEAGHDSDSIFAVVGVDMKFIYLCDGKERPVQKPKRKNPKHVKKLNFMLKSEDMATNRRLRKALGLIADAT